MINLTILSGFLLDLSYGHGYLAMKETRNANPPKKEKFNETWDDDRIATMRRTWRKSHRTSYRTELNTGAPCGGRGLVGFAETELPSMDGPSSDFGGARVSVRVGSTIEMPIKMTANHGGFHFAAAYCSEGKEPTAKSFIPNMPEGWKVLKLAQGDAWKQKLNGPKFPFYARGIPDEDKIKFLECDAYIPHKYPTYHPIKLYYDIPEDLCEGAETKEAIISWIWESDLRLAPLNPDRYTNTDNNCRPVFYENRCGQKTLDTFATDFWQQKKACDEYGEVWYNCFDAKVATDGETDEQQGIPMMTATTATTTAGEITAEKTLKEMEPEAGCMAYDYLQYISTMDESVLAKIFETIEGLNPGGNRASFFHAASRRLSVEKDDKYRWPDNTVTYDTSDLAPEEKQNFEDVIQRIQNRVEGISCLRFVPKTTGYRLRIFQTASGGCVTAGRGYLAWNRHGGNAFNQSMALTASCLRAPGTMIHEILHVLGFQHTHNRPDRDLYVKISPEYRDSEQFKKGTWEKFNTYGLPYDYESIMHYGPMVPLAIETVDPAKQGVIGQREKLSDGDVKLIGLMYPCKGDQKERDGQEGTEEDEDAPESLTEFEGLLKMFVGQVREKCSMWLGEDCFEDLLESKFVEYIRENDAFMRSLNFPADAAEGEFEQKTKDFINHIHATNGTIMCGGATEAAANSTTPPKTPVTASDSCAIQSGRGCSEVEKCVKVEDKDQNAEHKCIRVDEWQENHLCKPSRGYRRIDKKRRGNRATPKTCRKYCMQKRNRNKDINGVGFYPNQNGQWRCLCFKGDVTLTKRDLHYPKNKDAICMILNSSRGQQPK